MKVVFCTVRPSGSVGYSFVSSLDNRRFIYFVSDFDEAFSLYLKDHGLSGCSYSLYAPNVVEILL